MIEDHSWPDGFEDPTPMTTFGAALTAVLTDMVNSGCDVVAEEHWMWFSIERAHRKIIFVRRGRLGINYSWELILLVAEERIRLGPIFGIRDSACVVITKLDDLSTITKSWIETGDVHSVAQNVTFWDRMDAKTPLQLPDSNSS